MLSYDAYVALLLKHPSPRCSVDTPPFFCHSPDNHKKLGAILAIDELVLVKVGSGFEEGEGGGARVGSCMSARLPLCV